MSQPERLGPKSPANQGVPNWSLDDGPESSEGLEDSLFAPRPARTGGDSAHEEPVPASPVSRRHVPRRVDGDHGATPYHHFVIDPGSDPHGSLVLDSLLSPGIAHTVPRPASARPKDAADPEPRGGTKASGLPEPSATTGKTAPLPKPGETIGGFRVLTELGRGAFARVYLAEQIELSSRLVALKVSKPEGEEPQMLARLQHTHIVPIHSVDDDPVSGLRLLCMPYLGGANLAQTLEAAGGRKANGTGELSLVQALDEVSQRYHSATHSVLRSFRSASGRDSLGVGPRSALAQSGSVLSRPMNVGRPASQTPSVGRDSITKFAALWDRISWRQSASRARRAGASLDDRDFDQPARQFLRKASSVQAAVWVVARLAEGLDHAHSRGLLHRDLKPSNILIAADGTPMLLDFNLSTPRRVSSPEESEKAMLGGTLPYMSPEHLDAFNPNGSTHPDEVDERSDIYSLGLILFEMIAREHPFKEPPPYTPLLETIRHLADQRKRAPSIRAIDANVPWSLDAILKKCLDPDPKNRYTRARELAEDLNRFLDDRPLKFAPEPSLRERCVKWTRRNPRLCGTTSIALFAMLLITSFGGLIQLLHHNSVLMSSRLSLQVFRNDLNEARFLLNTSGGPVEHVSRGIELADQALKHLSVTPGGDFAAESFVRRLSVREREQVRQEAVELILLDAAAHVYVAERKGKAAERAQALTWAVWWLDCAERLDPMPPPSLFSDRARYREARGETALAASDRKRAEEIHAVSARDYSLLGVSLLARGDLARAEEAFTRAVDVEPRRFWSWFALGHCHFEQGRNLDAAGDFSACLALEPKFAWPYLNRGLCLARAGRLREAQDAYRHAIARNDRFAEAWFNLALVDNELNELDEAERCLGHAMALGRKETNVLVVWAEIKAKKGNRAEAEATFAQLLRARPDDPMLLTARGIFRIEADSPGALVDLRRAVSVDSKNPRAHFGLALALRRDDPKQALAEADRAYLADPSMMDALQLRALLRARQGDLAALEDVERLCQIPTPHRLYNAACALALLVTNAHEDRLATRALEFLGRAFEMGFPFSHAETDPDLAPIRALPGYKTLVERFRGAGQGRR